MCEQEEQLLLHSCPGRGGHLRSVRLRACPGGAQQTGDLRPQAAVSRTRTVPGTGAGILLYRRPRSSSPGTQANGSACGARPQPMTAPLSGILLQPASNSWWGASRDSPTPPPRTVAPPSGGGRHCRELWSDPPVLAERRGGRVQGGGPGAEGTHPAPPGDPALPPFGAAGFSRHRLPGFPENRARASRAGTLGTAAPSWGPWHCLGSALRVDGGFRHGIFHCCMKRKEKKKPLFCLEILNSDPYHTLRGCLMPRAGAT